MNEDKPLTSKDGQYKKKQFKNVFALFEKIQ